ncbi:MULTISPECIES: response regulator [unclassified Azospirillum]|uniref:response regulator n=1 Tax=unclassified Azospirillum TaxID=2630922 RepID=UPI000B6D9D74|nr:MULTISPECIES: response regulator transcription factor [unclassified Azospirillum]SNS49820.1 two-component system, OmpR family, KDP operon response regulator KdpE [Azospirillum sp. RU38E]SNS72029.1 two-component system, OmpR family, KDP operon response regulator KdpE [Azospirillum sp. RU37A]
MSRILVVDDEAPIRRFLRISLGANGHQVAEAENGAEALALVRADPPDLVILDLGLPDMDGQEVVSAIREISPVPILILSVRAGEADKVEALDRGAEDYVAKPFGIAELMARVRVALRRAPLAATSSIIQAGPVSIDPDRRIVTRDGAELRLSRREQDLLFVLARQADHVLTHRQILREVWGPAHVEDTAYLRVYIGQLRHKLEENPAEPVLIVTEPGVGYRLRTDGG